MSSSDRRTSPYIVNEEWDSFTYELIPEEETRAFSPSERLFLAVIIQAVEDATALKPSPHREQARSVLFSSSATGIKEMCLLLSIEYDYFLKGVRKMIDEGRALRRDSL